MTETFPRISGVVLDTTSARGLAEFYRALFGIEYRDGDAPPPAGKADPRGEDWLVLRGEGFSLGFQQVDALEQSTWPDPRVPQQLHLDTTVGSSDELFRQRDRALALGARVLHDRSDHPDEPLYVLADPDGHPFCIFVA